MTTATRVATFPVIEVFGPTVPARIARKIEVGASDECWPWKGATSGGGYGMAWYDHTTTTAHRVLWILLYGDPGELQIDHLCRNRRCCNPAHLEAVTARENTLRGDTPAARNAAKQECVHGHSLADAYRRPDGRRRCATCERDSSREYQRARVRGGGAV